LNFKGVQTFLKNLINSLKFHHHMIYLNVNLDRLTCIQILEVPLQVVMGTVQIISKIANHFRILCPLSQIHHKSKLDKECFKLN
jgi:hypothetical protein